jgi:hypothetical protein
MERLKGGLWAVLYSNVHCTVLAEVTECSSAHSAQGPSGHPHGMVLCHPQSDFLSEEIDPAKLQELEINESQ